MLHNIKAHEIELFSINYIQHRAVLYTRNTLPLGTTIADPKEIKKLLWKNNARLQFIPGKFFLDPERLVAIPAFNIRAITNKKSLIAVTNLYKDLQKIIPADSWLFTALTNVMFKTEYTELPKR